MTIKIRTLRKPLYLGFPLVLIIKYSWTYGGGGYTLIIIGGCQPEHYACACRWRELTGWLNKAHLKEAQAYLGTMT